MDVQAVERNRAQQAQWYGEPVGDTVRRVTAALELTQGQLAGLVGLSAPMLSQLASGQRAKIANPSVLARLQALTALADDPALPLLPRAEVVRRTEAVRSLDATGLMATGTGTGTAAAGGAEAVQALLRAVASADEVASAAALLEPGHPALAEALRVYGLGRTAEARRHWAAVVEGSAPGA